MISALFFLYFLTPYGVQSMSIRSRLYRVREEGVIGVCFDLAGIRIGIGPGLFWELARVWIVGNMWGKGRRFRDLIGMEIGM